METTKSTPQSSPLKAVFMTYLTVTFPCTSSFTLL